MTLNSAQLQMNRLAVYSYIFKSGEGGGLSVCGGGVEQNFLRWS